MATPHCSKVQAETLRGVNPIWCAQLGYSGLAIWPGLRFGETALSTVGSLQEAGSMGAVVL